MLQACWTPLPQGVEHRCGSAWSACQDCWTGHISPWQARRVDRVKRGEYKITLTLLALVDSSSNTQQWFWLSQDCSWIHHGCYGEHFSCSTQGDDWPGTDPAAEKKRVYIYTISDDDEHTSKIAVVAHDNMVAITSTLKQCSPSPPLSPPTTSWVNTGNQNLAYGWNTWTVEEKQEEKQEEEGTITFWTVK